MEWHTFQRNICMINYMQAIVKWAILYNTQGGSSSIRNLNDGL